MTDVPGALRRRQLVDEAKRVLMAQGMNESDAFASLQAAVVEEGLTWEEAAAEVISGRWV